MPSMDDIAKLAGVSKATVSLALASHPRISEETRKKVRTIAAQIGYVQRTIAAKSASSKPARKQEAAIGVLYMGSNQADVQGFFRDTLTGISEEASRRQANAVIIGISSYGEEADDREVYEKVIHSGVAGVIVVSGTPRVYGLDLLVERRFPMVFVGSRRLADREVPVHSVSSDNFDGGVIATERLLKLGHRNMAVMVGPDPQLSEIDRLNGFFSALRSAGIPASDERIVKVAGKLDLEEDGWRQLRRLEPTAVLATNMILGHMALQYYRLLEKNVPEDVSLIVFDDTAFFPLENPPITVIKQDMKALGTLSTEMLFDLLDQPGQPPRQLLIPVQLVERASCAPPPGERTD